MNVTELAVKRPAMMTMVIMLFVVLGLYTYNRIGVDLFPSINVPYIGVTVAYPGAGAEEVETQVVKPLEDAFSSLSKLKKITSIASEGSAVIILEFDLSANSDRALLDVEKKVDQVRGRLPDGAEAPVVIKRDPNESEIMTVAVASSRPLYETYELARDVLKDRLQTLPGVAEVSVGGGQEKEILVSINHSKLEGYGLTLNQVVNRIKAENINQPIGRLDRPQKEYNVRVLGEYRSLEDLKKVEIPLPSGNTVPLTAVAEVKEQLKEKRVFSRVNGQEAVTLNIYKQSDASVVAVADVVKAELKRLQGQLPPDVKLIIARDNSTFIRNALNATLLTILEGIITVGIVLFIFLREWRATATVMLAIPTSLISTLMVMYFAGFSFNMMTLMGLALCIGILVDDSIVVIENIHRHLKMGKTPIQAAIDGRMEIGLAAVAITMSDVVVFLPIAFMQGMVGQFFREFGLTIVFATLFSLFISFTLTPMLTSRLFKVYEGENIDRSIFRVLWRITIPLGAKVKETYTRWLLWSLAHRKTLLLTCTVAFVGSVMLIPLGIVGAEYMPRSDQGALTVSLEMPVGTPLEETNKELQKLEQFIKQIPEVKNCYAYLGGGRGFGSGSHMASVNVELVGKKERKRSVYQVGDQLREYARKAAVRNVRIIVSEVETMGGGMRGGAAGRVQMEVRGPDPDTLNRIVEQVKKELAQTPGAVEVNTNWRVGQPEVQVQVDHRRVAQYGLSVNEVASTLRAAMEGATAGVLRQGGRETDINVRIEGLNKDDVGALAGLAVQNSSGNQIRLSQVAEIKTGSGPVTIRRADRMRTITVTCGIRGRAASEFLADVRARMAKINLPPGYSINLGGEAQSMRDTFKELIRALLLSIVLIYMVLVMLYESFSTPLIRMLSLPLGLVGALVALALAGKNLNLFSMIGIIMMDGLVAKNGTLLLDYTHTLMNRGLTLREALIEAGRTRLKPILMTSFTMIFGMLPTALSLTEGSEFRSGMALVLIGGLITSTVFTLLVIPVVYTLIDDFKAARRAKKARRLAAEEER